MAQEEDTHSLEAKFDAAVKVIQSFPEEGDAALSECEGDGTVCACLCVNTAGGRPTCRAVT